MFAGVSNEGDNLQVLPNTWVWAVRCSNPNSECPLSSTYDVITFNCKHCMTSYVLTSVVLQVPTSGRSVVSELPGCMFSHASTTPHRGSGTGSKFHLDAPAAFPSKLMSAKNYVTLYTVPITSNRNTFQADLIQTPYNYN